MSQIKERPILFSAPMVRAILEDRKTVTRRAIKVQPHIDASGNFCVGSSNYGQDGYGKPVTKHFVSGCCPYGKPGDRLWVRETTEADYANGAVLSRYVADREPVLYAGCGDPGYNGSVAHWDYPRKSRPSIHMQRWASRILLEITAVRVERLQDITEEQAMAEGVGAQAIESFRAVGVDRPVGFAFRDLWTSINGGESWTANPWVWVVEFKRVTP